MDFLKDLIGVVLHLDKHLDFIIKDFGAWSYLFFFAIIFAETGLVVAPFLPGDSLLFVVGAFAALGSLNILWLFIVLTAAAIIGDSVNYAIGKVFGEKMLAHGDHRFFKKEHVQKTHRFYEKYGGKTIILARFIPIIRTFAPFVAGIGKMGYVKFFIYNVTGALLWVSLFVFGGYFFGNMPLIKKNFTLTIFAIIVISVVPVVLELWKHQKRSDGEDLRQEKKALLVKAFRFLKSVYLRIFRIHDSPKRIAAGFGLGVCLGAMPGTGPIASLVVASMLKVNRASALLGSVLTNTWLSIPVFFLSAKTGGLIFGAGEAEVVARWSALQKNFDWSGFFSWATIKVLIPVAVGYALVSVAIGMLAFGGAFLALTLFKKRKAATENFA
jgi:membrane-associated protein